jgi:hypothetical protein
MKVLWTADYIRGLNNQVIPYNDDNEDQDIQPGSILNYGCKDEFSVDNGVYDRQPIDDTADYSDVEPQLKDMYVFISICVNCTFLSTNILQFGVLAWLSLR